MKELSILGLSEQKGIPVVSSRKVADVFEKRHSDILRAIGNLGCSENFRERNFALSSIKRQIPNGGYKDEVEYLLTKDGFVFLAMGFTGEKAAQFKEAYIKAFNSMESRLKQIRDKSKEARNKFTETLKDHGYDKRHEYIQTTLQMKSVLGIGHKKSEMNEKELKLITAAEMIAEVNLETANAEEYYEVNPICLNSSLAVQNATIRRLA